MAKKKPTKKINKVVNRAPVQKARQPIGSYPPPAAGYS